MMLANERGPCPDAADMGVMERFSLQDGDRADRVDQHHRGGTSACIEPIPANIYTHKTLSGSFSIRNPHLERLLIEKSKNSEGDLVDDPRARRLGPASRFPHARGKGRVQDQLRDRPALADRARRRSHALYRPGDQSLNLFIPADVDKWDLLMLHYRAWELGIKSLYYLRSKIGAARRLRRRRRGRQHARPAARSSCRPPIMTSVWRASEPRDATCHDSALAGSIARRLAARARPRSRRPRPASSTACGTASSSRSPGDLALRADVDLRGAAMAAGTISAILGIVVFGVGARIDPDRRRDRVDPREPCPAAIVIAWTTM